MKTKQYQLDYYKRNREKRIAAALAWQAKHPDRYAYGREVQKRRRIKLRSEMIVAYGGECVCCGEKTPEFLTVDHINHDGQEHRGSIGGGGTNFLSALKKAGWPKETLRLLCMNCNWANRFGKTCPHQLIKLDTGDILPK